MTSKTFLIRLFLSVGASFFLSFSNIQAGNQPDSTVPGFSCYRDSASIFESLETIENNYPGLTQLTSIGFSWERRPIYLLKLTNQSINTTKPQLILLSGLRGNAFAPVELSLRFAEELLYKYGSDPDSTWMLDYLELHLILLANPDGRAKAEQQAQAGEDITWQNNTNNTCSTQEIGVRLNQNFPFQWRDSDIGPCDPSYAGPSAASEPETQAVMTYLEQLSEQSNQVLMLHLDGQDSKEKYFLSPYLFNPIAANPHIDELYTLAEKISYGTVSAPVRQGSNLELQPSYGMLVDYAYGTLGIPSLLFDMGGIHWYWYFEDYLLEPNMDTLRRAAKASADPYHRPFGPEVVIENINYDKSSLTIQGYADDYTTWWGGGADVYSQVKRLEFSVDLPPWHPDAILYPINGLTRDAEFDFISHFEDKIAYWQLPPGNHRLFIQAWDTEADGNPSNPGLVSAADIFVPDQSFFQRSFLPLIIKK